MKYFHAAVFKTALCGVVLSECYVSLGTTVFAVTHNNSASGLALSVSTDSALADCPAHFAS